jgi:hypothetical protein
LSFQPFPALKLSAQGGEKERRRMQIEPEGFFAPALAARTERGANYLQFAGQRRQRIAFSGNANGAANLPDSLTKFPPSMCLEMHLEVNIKHG